MKINLIQPVLALLLANGLAQAATITIVNVDGAGEGFNDATIVAAEPSGAPTTLGAERLKVFTAAANQWAAVLNSAVPIRINAKFDPQTCDANGAVLGSAGANSWVRSFAGTPAAPYNESWFAIAEANALGGVDLNTGASPAGDDIIMTFNLSIDAGCLPGTTGWWYGTNGADPVPAAEIALMPVVFHEIAHGLGFQTLINGATGEWPGGNPRANRRPDIWAHFLMDRNFSANGTTWVGLGNTNGGDTNRVASAIDDPNLVWSGANVTAAAQGYLSPSLVFSITAPPGIAGSYVFQSAGFGPPVALAGISGEVVAAVDAGGVNTLDGCEAITNAGAVNGKIALVDRGNCNFTVKVANAEAAGAIAVLVANNAAGLPGMGGTDPAIGIPSIGIEQALGASIRTNSPGVNVSLIYNFSTLVGMNGGYLRMYAPNPREPGSSVSHFSTAATPNLLMEPALNQELFNETDMTVPLFRDIFWPINEAAVLNKAPVLDAATEFAAIVNVASPLTEIFFSDIDAANDDLTVTFAVDRGTIGLNASAGVSLAGSGSATASITGPRALLVPYVAGGNVLFTSAFDDLVDAALTITVNDNGNNGTGGALSDTANAMIVVVVGNTPPTITGPSNQVINEDASTAALGVTIGDTETLPASLVLTGSSNNTTLVPNNPANIILGGAGTARTVTITPAANQSGTATITLRVTDAGNLFTETTFTVTANAVNDPPSFTRGGDQAVNEDAPAQTINPWATAISAGPSEVQNVNFEITNNTNAALFSVVPVVSAAGVLSYTPAANASGTATITLRICDDGVPVACSSTQSFLITVNPVNDPPSFTKGGDQAVNEDSPAQTVNPWATAISAGPGEAQNVAFAITNNTNAALFSAGPSVSATGVLTYAPASNAFGSATITLRVCDDGTLPACSATQTFVIAVAAVNDLPSFIKGADQSVNEDAGAQTVGSWATALSGGPGESDSLNFEITNNTNSALFSAGPAVSAGGVLTYTPAAGASGSATITLRICDNGAPPSCSATQSFLITVIPNDFVDFVLTKTDGVSSVVEGTSTVYTIVVRNNGNVSGTAFVADNLPPGLASMTWTCTGTGCGQTGPVVGNIADSITLAAGASITFTVTGVVNGGVGTSIDNFASVEATVPPESGTNADNSATDSNQIIADDLFENGFETAP